MSTCCPWGWVCLWNVLWQWMWWMWLGVLFERTSRASMIGQAVSLCLGARQHCSLHLGLRARCGADPRDRRLAAWAGRGCLFGGVGYLASPDHVLIERIGQFETFLLLGQFQIVPASWEWYKSCPVDRMLCGSPFCLHVSTDRGLPWTEELLHLQFPNSYKTTVPKLLSALHITKNRTTLPGKDA